MSGCNVSTLKQDASANNPGVSDQAPIDNEPAEVVVEQPLLVLSQWPDICRSTAIDACQSEPVWTKPESEILRYPRGSVVLSHARIADTFPEQVDSTLWPDTAIRADLISMLVDMIPTEQTHFVISDWSAFITKMQSANHGSELWLALSAAQIEALANLVYGAQVPLFSVNTQTLSQVNASPTIQNLSADDYQALQNMLLALYQENSVTHYSWSGMQAAFADIHVTSTTVTLDGWRLYHQTLTAQTRTWLTTQLHESEQWVINDVMLEQLRQASDANWGIAANDYLGHQIRDDVIAILQRLQGQPGRQVAFDSLEVFAEHFGQIYGQWDSASAQYLPYQPAYTDGQGLLGFLGDAFTQELKTQLLLQPAEKAGKTVQFQRSMTVDGTGLNKLQSFLPSGTSVVYVTGGTQTPFSRADYLNGFFGELALDAYWLAMEPGLGKARAMQQCTQYAAWFVREGGQLTELAEFADLTQSAIAQCEDVSANLQAIANADVVVIDDGDVMRLIDSWMPQVEPGIRRPTLEWLALSKRLQQKQLRVLSVGRAAALFSGQDDVPTVHDSAELIWNQTDSNALANGGITSTGTLFSLVDSLVIVSDGAQESPLLPALRFAIEQGHKNFIAMAPRTQIQLLQNEEDSWLQIDTGFAWVFDLSSAVLKSTPEQPFAVSNLRIDRWAAGTRLQLSQSGQWLTALPDTNVSAEHEVVSLKVDSSRVSTDLLEAALQSMIINKARKVSLKRTDESASFNVQWIRDDLTRIEQVEDRLNVYQLRMDILPE